MIEHLYYELLEDGTIGRSTNDAATANELGLTLETDREIVYGYNGKRYFKGEEPPRPLTFADYDNAMEAHLDAEKGERGYTKREPTDYASSSVPRFAQDAADWAAHRDAVMEYGLAIENKAKRGEPVPTLEEFKAGLPKISWTIPALLIAFAISSLMSAQAAITKMATEAALLNVSNRVEIAETNAIATANAYTDAAIEAAGGVTPESVTNTAESVIKRDVPEWARAENPPTVTETDPTVPKWAKQPNPPESMTDNAAVLTNGTLQTKGGAAITPANIGAATAQAAQAAQRTAEDAAQQSRDTQAVVVQLAGQINGSNVVFVVTNYISGAYVLDAAKLQIRELRDGTYRTIYNSRDEINLHLADFETNKLNVTRETLRQEIAAVLESMQRDAWGRRTSTGNPAPSNTIYTTEPSFVFGGGLEYERIAVGAGAIGILADKGAPSYTAGDSGTFMFKDATGENYFGYSMTTGYAIGVPTDGIQVSGQRVTLTYNIVGSCPIVMWCPALFPGCAKDITGPGWYQLNDEEGNPIEGAPFECAVDMESTPEVATVYIDTGANPTGFFSAWTSVPGKSSFKTNMPVDLDAANGGGVVSSDGHTVIVPQPDGTWRPSNAN